MWCTLSFVLSRPSSQFATVKSQIYWGLLKTVLSCRQFSSHLRHGQDKTVLSWPYRWCKLGNNVRIWVTSCVPFTPNAFTTWNPDWRSDMFSKKVREDNTNLLITDHYDIKRWSMASLWLDICLSDLNRGTQHTVWGQEETEGGSITMASMDSVLRHTSLPAPLQSGPIKVRKLSTLFIKNHILLTASQNCPKNWAKFQTRYSVRLPWAPSTSSSWRSHWSLLLLMKCC